MTKMLRRQRRQLVFSMASDSFLNLCNPWSIRDIPMPLVSSGVEHGNLRELALARMKDMGTEVRL